MPAFTAVTAVVVVIVLLLFLNSRPTHHGNGPGPAVVATGPSPTASSTSAKPPATSDAHETAAAPVAPPMSEPPATQRPAVAKLRVTVLNNSRISGLAHDAAARVARGGWPVRYVGNFTGRIAASTIYYAAGQRRSAELFAREFPAVRRVLPRFPGLPGSGLTLVVTRDWPA